MIIYVVFTLAEWQNVPKLNVVCRYRSAYQNGQVMSSYLMGLEGDVTQWLIVIAWHLRVSFTPAAHKQQTPNDCQ